MTSSWVAAGRLDFSLEWSRHQHYIKLSRQAKCGHHVSSFSLLCFLLGQPGQSPGMLAWGGAGGAQGSSDPSGRGQHADFASVSCLTGVPTLSGGSLEGEGINCPDHSAASEFRTRGLVCEWEQERLWAPAPALGKSHVAPHITSRVCIHGCACVRTQAWNSVGSRDEGEG